MEEVLVLETLKTLRQMEKERNTKRKKGTTMSRNTGRFLNTYLTEPKSVDLIAINKLNVINLMKIKSIT